MGRNSFVATFFRDGGVIGDEEEFKRWKQTEIEVYDGGFWFWHVYYDPSTGKCIKFKPNGYA